MTSPPAQEPADAPPPFDQPGRPRRPQLSRDPAPLRPVRPPDGVRRLFGVWTASCLTTFLGLLGAVLFLTDARQELLDARPDASEAIRSAIGWLHLGALGVVAVVVLLEVVALARVKRHRRGRIAATLLVVVHAAASPLLIEVAAGPGPVGLAVAGLLGAGAVLAVVGAVWLWLPLVTRWLRG